MLSEGAFNSLLARERSRHPAVILSPALLLVDFQRYFTDRESPAYLEGIESTMDRTAELIDIFLQCRMPVASTVHKGGSPLMREWWGNAVDEPWIFSEFKGFPTFAKSGYDAFYGTDLEAFLESKGVNQLVICGVMTHLCCETTARSAFVRGYRIIMVEDGLCDKSISYHVWSLKSLSHGFASVARTTEIVELLERR